MIHLCHTDYDKIKEKAIFSPDGSQPQSLYSEGKLKVMIAGLEARQSIPIHPEGLAVYTFLEGKGWMFVDGERLPVSQGAMVITPAGAKRGIESESRLTFMATRIADSSHWFA